MGLLNMQWLLTKPQLPASSEGNLQCLQGTLLSSLLHFLFLLIYLLLWGNMAGMPCTFLPQSHLWDSSTPSSLTPLEIPDRPAHPPNSFAKAQVCLEEEAPEEEG